VTRGGAVAVESISTSMRWENDRGDSAYCRFAGF
jgi:hypothetical protein